MTQDQAAIPLASIPQPPDVSVGFTSGQLGMGPRLTPRKIISIYDATEWEVFIQEWAYTLGGYHQVRRYGGSGDRGLDVVGLLSVDGLQGDWHGYQCKHYTAALTLSQGLIEIRKVLIGAMEADWRLPQKYAFVAPRGCGTQLSQLLDNAPLLKKVFLSKLGNDRGVTGDLTGEQVSQLKEFAKTADFSVFAEEDIEVILVSHRSSPYHLARFGGSLPPRVNPDLPPIEPAEKESRYVLALLRAYLETHGEAFGDFETCNTDPKTSAHLLRQREAFYCAESLREFARDQVPSGTFEQLTDDVYHGVITTADKNYSSGLERLNAVLEQSTNLQINANALIQATRSQDRHGICHQLVNEDRLAWVRA